VHRFEFRNYHTQDSSVKKALAIRLAILGILFQGLKCTLGQNASSLGDLGNLCNGLNSGVATAKILLVIEALAIRLAILGILVQGLKCTLGRNACWLGFLVNRFEYRN